MIKKALIIGIYGQDGFYLSNLLLKKKNYKVYGVSRIKKIKTRAKISNKVKIFTLKKNNDSRKFNKILNIGFDEIYFAGGQSSVKNSFSLQEYETFESQIFPIQIILEYIRTKNKKTKFLYFCSSEIFGDHKKNKIKESDKKKPLSPYGLAKLASFEIIKSYRKMFNLPVFSVIFFNHESSLRDKAYVIKKVILAVKKIKKKTDRIYLGNINVKRDWGWAPEYMLGCYKIMKIKNVDDYIIATGRTVALKKVIRMIFNLKKLDWNKYVRTNQKNIRIADIKENYADISKIKNELNWHPKVRINEIIKKIYNNKV
jgi:GDPmannose 4,6-dehydratase